MISVAWIYLIIAGLLEPCWVVSLKKSEKFRNIRWTAATVAFLAASLYLLSLSMVTLPAGTAYAVWTGIGAAGALLAGIILYKESVTAARMFFVLIIVAGIVGLKITTVV